jgi:membrane-associated phospholipid phosphatase
MVDSSSEPDETQLPEQQVGDTPVPPWKMPEPEQKAAAQPVRRTLHEALAAVDSQEKADALLGALASATTEESVADVEQSHPPVTTPRQAVEDVTKAAESASEAMTPKAVLDETARVIVSADEPTREAVAEAAQEVFNPQQQGASPVVDAKQRAYLHRAVLKRLKPLDALDARLFLAINHLPHTRLLNRFFYTITLVFTGGTAWYALMAALLMVRPRLGWRIVRGSLLPLAITTVILEHPVKRYFRRKRPFIDIIQATVIGKKPGTWSFPSGHSATAFAGAWLFSCYFRKLRPLFYTIASLVAFSRIYLGDHYPGDVVSGSTLGTLFAVLLRRLLRRIIPEPR